MAFHPRGQVWWSILAALAAGACGSADDTPVDADGADGGGVIADGGSVDSTVSYAPDSGEPRLDDAGPPSAGACEGGPVLDLGSPPVARVVLSTEGAEDHGRPSSACSSRGAGVPDAVLRYTPSADGIVAVSTFGAATNFDTVVYIRSACDGTGEELGCNDDLTSLTGHSLATAPAHAGVPVFVVIDGYGPSEVGTVAVSVQLLPEPTPVAAAERCETALLLTTAAGGDVQLGVGAGTIAGATDDESGTGCAGVDHAFAVSLTQYSFVRAELEGAPGVKIAALRVCDPLDACSGAPYEAGLTPGSYTLVLEHDEAGPPATEPYELRFVAVAFAP